jgi:hypothetical protein
VPGALRSATHDHDAPAPLWLVGLGIWIVLGLMSAAQIMCVRFGDRLMIDVHTEPEVMSALVPDVRDVGLSVVRSRGRRGNSGNHGSMMSVDICQSATGIAVLTECRYTGVILSPPKPNANSDRGASVHFGLPRTSR